jgi:hypothetical protein
MNRRPATDADLTIGTTVYRGRTAKKAYTVTGVYEPETHTPIYRYSIGQGSSGYAARNLWIEEAAPEAPAPVDADRCADCGDFLDWCPRSGLTTDERTAMREAREG